MSQEDSELHMLRFWIHDKGIETAFRDYYPNLAKNDAEIRHCLSNMRSARISLMVRVNELMEQHGEQE